MYPTISGRQRRRLELARETGWLDARCRDHAEIVRIHGRWCWRLRIPFVWMERRSPRSRYGRLHLEMFTTGNVLTAQGEATLRALGSRDVSAYGACWSRVPIKELDELARQVFRVATKSGNYQARDVKNTPQRVAAAAA